MCNLNQTPFMNMGFFIWLFYSLSFWDRTLPAFCWQESLSLLSSSEILQIEEDMGCGDSVLSLGYLQWCILTRFSKSFCITAKKAWVVTSNRQGLDEVPFVNFLKVVRYLFYFGIYLFRKHVIYPPISGACS